jgi:hypothetical protein
MSDDRYLERLRCIGRQAPVLEPSAAVSEVPFTGLEAFTLDYNVCVDRRSECLAVEQFVQALAPLSRVVQEGTDEIPTSLPSSLLH